MTQEAQEAAFSRGLAELLERFDRSTGGEAREPFAGAGIGAPLEHTTRIHLLDELLKLLGWTLGLGGDVEEEARVKAQTTTFLDYLGVARQTNTPVLVVEAKAFDAPFIAPGARGTNTGYDPADLLAQAIEHWRNGGDRSNSPAAPGWHDHVQQVGGYVRNLRDRYGHPVPRAMLTSGQWFVVFKRPVATFLSEPARAADIELFHLDDLRNRAWRFHRLLCKSALVVETPYHIRATQVPGYITAESLAACYHALHVSYESSGSPIVFRLPRILVYAALVLQRSDGAYVTVLDDSCAIPLCYERGSTDLTTALGPHLEEVDSAARRLLEITGEQLGMNLRPATIGDFPGYPLDARSDRARGASLVKRHFVEPDVWMLVTGRDTHFLRQAPNVSCRFHHWKSCREHGQGSDGGAISVARMESPRSFFTDEQPHHCAHQGLHDRREARCQVHLIDERLCCRSCVYEPVCWPGILQPPLPCGR